VQNGIYTQKDSNFSGVVSSLEKITPPPRAIRAVAVFSQNQIC
jgi:hypothetical protein